MGTTALKICNDLNEVFETHGISLELFSKAVLNLSHNTFDKYLSKPNLYKTCLLARITYVKIYAWLNDPCGLDKLQKWTKKWKCKFWLCKCLCVC